jgi:hypothetical protein
MSEQQPEPEAVAPETEPAPDLPEGTDVASGSDAVEQAEDAPVSSDAEAYREDPEQTQGGTGGLDSGGAG